MSGFDDILRKAREAETAEIDRATAQAAQRERDKISRREERQRTLALARTASSLLVAHRIPHDAHQLLTYFQEEGILRRTRERTKVVYDGWWVLRDYEELDGGTWDEGVILEPPGSLLSYCNSVFQPVTAFTEGAYRHDAWIVENESKIQIGIGQLLVRHDLV